MFLSVTGYAMAGLFVLSGAPDLALTQAAVETLSTVVFVLVLRRLPEHFERQSSPRRRVVRLAIAGAVGVTVFVFALVAAGHRLTPPVSDEMIARSVPDGHGRNVVNVILVDFRGFDTLGEITVLAVACLGAAALARVGRRAGEPDGAPRPTNAGPPRLVFVDTSVRVVFHAVLLMSLWLLFAGHNQPGGGFVGGLLAGSAITLRYIAGGIDEVRGLSRFRPWTVLGAGILLAATTATIPLLLGNGVLEVGLASLDLPVVGAVTVSSALAFDTGVYLAVIGMVLMAFESFGDDPDGGRHMTVMLAAVAAALFAIGTYLLLQRKLSRIIIGLGLLTHGANLLLITGGSRGNPPIVGSEEGDGFADPMPQALALTAIVITFGVTILLLALAYRSWLLTADDEVQDDVGDRAVGRSDVVHDEVADQEKVIEREEAP